MSTPITSNPNDPGIGYDPDTTALGPDGLPLVQAAAFTPPPFPTWPPPSGGAPVNAPELGPIQNPFPYGGGQTANISTASPAPLPKATAFPQSAGKAINGQNQSPPAGWPAWPVSRVVTLPDKASPSISAISPPPIMGPGATGQQFSGSPDPGSPFPQKTFPAGSYIDGYGQIVTPTRIIGGLGN